jgi:hypothetical protein
MAKRVIVVQISKVYVGSVRIVKPPKRSSTVALPIKNTEPDAGMVPARLLLKLPAAAFGRSWIWRVWGRVSCMVSLLMLMAYTWSIRREWIGVDISRWIAAVYCAPTEGD